MKLFGAMVEIAAEKLSKHEHKGLAATTAAEVLLFGFAKSKKARQYAETEKA